MTARDGKPCRKCGANEWYKDGRRCIPCSREASLRYIRTNPDKCNERNRRWKDANKDKVRVYAQRWIDANQDKWRENSRRWGRKNSDRVVENVRRWKNENPDKARVHNSRIRAKRKGAAGSHTAADWKAICEQYDHRCLRCGKQEPEIKLTVDHVLPLTKGGSDNADNLQPLCQPCNLWKHARHIDFRTKPGLLRWLQKKLF